MIDSYSHVIEALTLMTRDGDKNEELENHLINLAYVFAGVVDADGNIIDITKAKHVTRDVVVALGASPP